MRFRPRAFREEPEINFIPLIDVLLVILIFLMVTTTYSRYAELKINLPTGESVPPPQRLDQVDIGIDAQGNYSIDRKAVSVTGAGPLSQEIQKVAGAMKDPMIVISAD